MPIKKCENSKKHCHNESVINQFIKKIRIHEFTSCLENISAISRQINPPNNDLVIFTKVKRPEELVNTAGVIIINANHPAAKLVNKPERIEGLTKY